MFHALTARHPGLVSILRNGMWKAVMVLYTFVIRLSYVLALSHYLGPEGYGFFSYAQTFYLTALPFVLLGMDALLPREIGKHRKNAEDLMVRIFSLRLTLGVGFALIAAVIGFWTEDYASHQWMLFFISFALIPRSLQTYSCAVFDGFENAKQEAKFSALFRAFEVAMGVTLLVVFKADVTWIIGLHVLAWAGYGFFSCRYIHRNYAPLTYRWDFLVWRTQLLGENIPLAIYMLAQYLLSSSALLIYRHTSDDLALYGQVALAYQAIVLASGFLVASIAGSTPILARSHQRGDGKDHLFVLAVSTLFFVVGWSVVWLVGLLGAPLILMVLGERYSQTAEIFASMAYWLPFWLAGQPFVRFFFIRKHYRPMILSYVSGLVLLVSYLATGDAGSTHTLIEACIAGYAAFFAIIVGYYFILHFPQFLRA